MLIILLNLPIVIRLADFFLIIIKNDLIWLLMATNCYSMMLFSENDFEGKKFYQSKDAVF